MTTSKRTFFVIGGSFWFLVAAGFCFFLFDYVNGGAGLQIFRGPVNSGSVLLGLVHVTGFGAAIVICFAIGAGLCARGLIAHREHK
jgi:hypothetical protein